MKERCFNTEGGCCLKIYYMVRLDKRMRQISELYVDKGKYFVINGGRYGMGTSTMRIVRNSQKILSF